MGIVSVSKTLEQEDKMSKTYHKQIVNNYTFSFPWLNSSWAYILHTQQPVSDNMSLLQGLELWNSGGLTGILPVDVNG